MVVKELSQESVLSSDLTKLKQRFSPASTFKIPHALIALSEGIVKDPQEIFFFYDGHSKYFLKAWEKDMGLKEAVQTSNVEAFKVMAHKIGRHKMQEALKAFDYGNKIIGDKLEEFWLDGSLKISALEQVLFLEKLVTYNLPILKTAQREVVEILKLESLDDFVLS